jgi:hypothetical protein
MISRKKLIEKIFMKEATKILGQDKYEAKEHDDQIDVPAHYYPLIPMMFANGTEGIGTGWSNNTDQFHPYDIINLVSEMVRVFGEKVQRGYDWNTCL